MITFSYDTSFYTFCNLIIFVFQYFLYMSTLLMLMCLYLDSYAV